MRHKFESTGKDYNENNRLEKCVHCPSTRAVSKLTGHAWYPYGNLPCGQINLNQGVTKKRGRKPKTDQPIEQVEKRPLVAEIKEIPQSFLQDKALVDRLDTVVQNVAPYPDRTISARKTMALTDAEARLKEALVIINVLYEDAVGAGLRTNGRFMAGRYLYSQGYSETVKAIDR